MLTPLHPLPSVLFHLSGTIHQGTQSSSTVSRLGLRHVHVWSPRQLLPHLSAHVPFSRQLPDQRSRGKHRDDRVIHRHTADGEHRHGHSIRNTCSQLDSWAYGHTPLIGNAQIPPPRLLRFGLLLGSHHPSRRVQSDAGGRTALCAL